MPNMIRRTKNVLNGADNLFIMFYVTYNGLESYKVYTQKNSGFSKYV